MKVSTKMWSSDGCFNPARDTFDFPPHLSTRPSLDDIALARRGNVCFLSHSQFFVLLTFWTNSQMPTHPEHSYRAINYASNPAEEVSFQALLNCDIEGRISVKMTGRTCRFERDLFITNIEVAEDKSINSDVITLTIGHGGHKALRYARISVTATAAKLFDPEIRDRDLAEIL
jgi:hypothetical protein